MREGIFQLKVRQEFAILPEREKFEKGVALFNARDFFECHDVIEEIWMEWRGPDRKFFQGIIHVAVGFYHLDNENYRGSRSQLSKGIAKLEQFQPAYYDIELKIFLTQVSSCLQWVTQREQGLETVPFDAGSIPTLRFLNQ